jgi:hypothetical protein
VLLVLLIHIVRTLTLKLLHSVAVTLKHDVALRVFDRRSKLVSHLLILGVEAAVVLQ